MEKEIWGIFDSANGDILLIQDEDKQTEDGMLRILDNGDILLI